jgi:ABC-2 type transport system permease protein
MFRILIKKYINESILLWTACSLVLLLFPWVRIWTVSQFELSGFAPILKQFRAFEKFSPVPLEQFLTYHGIIGFTFDEPVLILCVLVWSIARGSDLVSGELGRGTMEMMLSQPISRGKIVSAHALVTITGLMLLCGFVYLGISLGIQTNTTLVRESVGIRIPWLNMDLTNPLATATPRQVPLTELVSPSLYIVPTLNLFGLGFLMLGLSVAVSAFDSYRWRTIGIVIGTYVLQLLLFVLSKSTPKLGSLKPFSFLAAYQPDWIVQTVHRDPSAAWAWTVAGNGVTNGSAGERRLSEDGSVAVSSPANEIWSFDRVGPLSYVSILIALGLIFYVAGYLRFRGRDLPAPQ